MRKLVILLVALTLCSCGAVPQKPEPLRNFADLELGERINPEPALPIPQKPATTVLDAEGNVLTDPDERNKLGVWIAYSVSDAEQLEMYLTALKNNSERLPGMISAARKLDETNFKLAERATALERLTNFILDQHYAERVENYELKKESAIDKAVNRAAIVLLLMGRVAGIY